MLKFDALCPHCGKGDNLIIDSNQDDYSEGVILYTGLQTDLENSTDILFTECAREFAEGAILELHFKQPIDFQGSPSILRKDK